MIARHLRLAVPPSGARVRTASATRLGVTLLAGPGALHALGDEPFAGRDAFAHHAQASCSGPSVTLLRTTVPSSPTT